jgi:LPXTG-motif cell wall-anchored protein
LVSQPSTARLSFAAFSGDDQSVVFFVFGAVLLGSLGFFFDGALLRSFPFF